MHILYLHQYFCPPGGTGNNRSFELAKYWVSRGHKVSMLTSPAYFSDEWKSQQGSSKIWKTQSEGINIVSVNVDYNHMMSFSKRVKAFLNFYRQALRLGKSIEQVDLIYASSTPLTVGELGRKLAKYFGVPYLFETVDVWPDVPIGMGIIKNFFLKKWLNRKADRIYKEATHIISLSEGMKAQVCSHGVHESKVSVVHNGTNPEMFPYVERISKEEVKVYYTGTVGIANGLDELLKAARILMGEKHIRFYVLGNGNDLERIKKLAKDWNLSNVNFIPPVPKEEVSAHLNKADIGLVCFAPYKVLEANSANKFYDYLASGLAVVINYEGWQSVYLKENNAGLSSKLGDEDALAQNILRLANEPETRKMLGLNGRKLAEEKFDRRRAAANLLEKFQEIIT